uniref:Integrase, catalytic region, zinc finger, CCHC-type, peptidase aspartic, catalytic n=1 Tax=Tanacetum cinerariifolium TaxID=118510 RepID=A0A6L2K8Q8_TANCI|nr:hypothetical protein [Tanacetum cinerariifolium]
MWFCEVELRLIALNSELQVFHMFSDNNVPNPHVDCVEQGRLCQFQNLVVFCLKAWLRFVSKTSCVLSQDLLHFVSRFGCVLSQDLLRFVSRLTAFCLKTLLRFVSRLGCILSQDLLRFVSRLTAFCLKIVAFCLKIVAFCLQASCVLSTFEDLFCVLGKENGVNILKSIDDGPYQMGTVREPLAEGTEGAPHLGLEQPRVYSDLSLEEKDRHLGKYKDASGRVRINQRGLGVTTGRFVTTVKLNRGLRDSNYDQLYAYLKQHETHHYSPSSSTLSSTHVPQHLADNAHHDSSLSPMENFIENLTNTLALLTQSYKTFLPQTNNQLQTSSNTRNQATVQDGRVVVQNVQGRQNRGQGMNPHGGGAAGYGGVQNRVGNANPGGQDNAIDDDVDEQPIQDLALNVDNVFQAEECDAFDYDMDEAPIAQTMFMANLSSADPVTDEA